VGLGLAMATVYAALPSVLQELATASSPPTWLNSPSCRSRQESSPSQSHG
jgi:hypothetical protein